MPFGQRGVTQGLLLVTRSEQNAHQEEGQKDRDGEHARDANGQPGAYEAALMDRHRLHDPKQPLEIQRTVHSFDPCIACAVHVVDPQGEALTTIRVR